MNVFARSLDGLDGDQPALSGVRVGIAPAEEARGWFERYGADGDWAEPDGVAFMTIRTAQKADTQLFLAWIDGQPAGGGALEIHDGVAALMAADTLPAYRKRGLHTLLLHARLAAATAAGCDLALVHTAPSASQNNAAGGLQLACTALRWFPADRRSTSRWRGVRAVYALLRLRPKCERRSARMLAANRVRLTLCWLTPCPPC